MAPLIIRGMGPLVRQITDFRSFRIVSSFLSTGIEGTPSFRLVLLKRSEKVSLYPNLYAACSGTFEATDCSPYDAALRELKEETGLAPPDITLIRQGDRYLTKDKRLGKEWMIYPFLWRITPSPSDAEGPEARIRELSSSLEESGFSELVPHLQRAAEEVKLESMIKLNWENTKVLVVEPEKLKDIKALMVPNLIRGMSRVVKHLPREWTQLKGNRVPPESLVKQLNDKNIEEAKDRQESN